MVALAYALSIISGPDAEAGLATEQVLQEPYERAQMCEAAQQVATNITCCDARARGTAVTCRALPRGD